MFELDYKELFFTSLEKVVRDNLMRKLIVKKTEELKLRPTLGKKLKGSPYWSLRVHKFRIIYKIEGNKIIILRVLPRKQDYREI